MSSSIAYPAFKSDILYLEGSKDSAVDNKQTKSQYICTSFQDMSAAVAPEFLLVKPGDIVVVEDDALVVEGKKIDWWVAYVMYVVGGARDPRSNSLFQVACVDTGVIRTINADVVKGILRAKK